MIAAPSRPTCRRCRRPESACWCTGLTPLSTSTRVVFLQHPRESRVAIGTARIAHLGLAGSELYEGVTFEDHPRIQELLSTPGTALLFPGPEASAPDALDHPPKTLIVIDGTWPQARKVMVLNPALRALPRIGFMPRAPGNYRIRREPARHCVATVEAVVEVLAALEKDGSRFAPLLQAFQSMVDRQIAAKAARTEPVRRRLKTAGPWWESAAMPDLHLLWPNLVAIAGEANSHHRASGIPGLPELIQLAAIRPATGEVFQAFLAPRRPLAPSAARHLDVAPEVLMNGATVTEVLSEWRRFLRPDDRLVGWGRFAWELLAQEGWVPECNPIDLRGVAAHRLKRRPGTAESAARAIEADLESPSKAPGRAGRTVHALATLVGALRKEQQVGTQKSRACQV